MGAVTPAADPSTVQEQQLLRWCGNARLAFNYALAAKKAAHERWRSEVDALVESGVEEDQARRRVRVPIRLATYRRLRLPKFGEVRLHESAKRLARLIDRGAAVVQSVTVSRGGSRWYASVLCKVLVDIPDRPTRRQRGAGTVGVDLGVKVLAAFSKPLDPNVPHSVVGAARCRMRCTSEHWN